GVGWIGFDAGIHNGDDLVARRVEICQQPRGIGEAVRVEGEYAIAVHVVYVEPERITGDTALAELGGDLAHLLLREITPAALAVAKRPEWRKRRVPGEIRVAREHCSGGRAGEDVVGEVTTGGTEAEQVGTCRTCV